MAPLCRPRVVVLLAALVALAGAARAQQPAPPVWPELFSAILFQNRSGALAITELYYDHRRGLNLNVIRPQLGGSSPANDSAAMGGGGAVFDLELDTGDSYIWRTAAAPGAHAAAGAGARVLSCKRLHFDVGILRPNWLEGARHLGVSSVDGGFLSDVYEKADFIRYYSEVEGSGDDGEAAPPQYRRRPVRWNFLETGAEFNVLEFAAGRDARPVPKGAWRPPKECFQGDGGGGDGDLALPPNAGRIWRMMPAVPTVPTAVAVS